MSDRKIMLLLMKASQVCSV